MDFKQKHTLEQRKAESKKVLDKYDNRIPLIVQKHHSCKLNDIESQMKYTFRCTLIELLIEQM